MLCVMAIFRTGVASYSDIATNLPAVNTIGLPMANPSPPANHSLFPVNRFYGMLFIECIHTLIKPPLGEVFCSVISVLSHFGRGSHTNLGLTINRKKHTKPTAVKGFIHVCGSTMDMTAELNCDWLQIFNNKTMDIHLCLFAYLFHTLLHIIVTILRINKHESTTNFPESDPRVIQDYFTHKTSSRS